MPLEVAGLELFALVRPKQHPLHFWVTLQHLPWMPAPSPPPGITTMVPFVPLLATLPTTAPSLAGADVWQWPCCSLPKPQAGTSSISGSCLKFTSWCAVVIPHGPYTGGSTSPSPSPRHRILPANPFAFPSPPRW